MSFIEFKHIGKKYAGLNSVMHLNNSIFLPYNKPVSTHDLCFYAY